MTRTQAPKKARKMCEAQILPKASQVTLGQMHVNLKEAAVIGFLEDSNNCKQFKLPGKTKCSGSFEL